MARQLILLAIVWFGLGAAGVADDIGPNRGTLTGFHGGSSSDAGIQFNYRVTFKIWAMMNEPVYDIGLVWSFDERARIMPDNMTGFRLLDFQDIPFGGPVNELDNAVRSTVRPYDIKVRIFGHLANNPQARYAVEWDVGVPGQSGEMSYNTPTAPRWDELFFHADTRQTPVGADEAKTIVKGGFIADKVEILSVKWHLDDYIRAMKAKYGRGKPAALKRAARRHIDILANLQNLPRQQLDRRLEELIDASEKARRSGDPNFLAPLEAFVNKLAAGVPAPMRNGGLDAEYQAALADVQSEYDAELATVNRLELQLTSEYPAWVVAKRAEIDARRKVETAEAQPQKGTFDGDWFVHGKFGMRESRNYCTFNLVHAEDYDSDCGTSFRGEQCSFSFYHNGTFRLRTTKHDCLIEGTYTYGAADRIHAVTNDGASAFDLIVWSDGNRNVVDTQSSGNGQSVIILEGGVTR